MNEQKVADLVEKVLEKFSRVGKENVIVVVFEKGSICYSDFNSTGGGVCVNGEIKDEKGGVVTNILEYANRGDK